MSGQVRLTGENGQIPVRHGGESRHRSRSLATASTATVRLIGMLLFRPLVVLLIRIWQHSQSRRISCRTTRLSTWGNCKASRARLASWSSRKSGRCCCINFDHPRSSHPTQRCRCQLNAQRAVRVPPTPIRMTFLKNTWKRSNSKRGNSQVREVIKDLNWLIDFVCWLIRWSIDSLIV